MASVLTADQLIDMALYNLTNGVIPDFNTALTGGMLLAVVYVGGSIIFDVLSVKVAARRREHQEQLAFAQNVFDSSRSFNDARNYRSMRDMSEEGSFDYDYYNSLYRAKLNESVSLSAKTGQAMSTGSALFDDGGHDTHFDSLVSDEPSFSIGVLEVEQSPGSSRTLYDFTAFHEEPSSSISSLHVDDPGPSDADRPYDEEY